MVKDRGSSVTNGEICKIIEQLDEVEDLFSEKCVKEGYGQNCGGYLEQNKEENISQKQHFLLYYNDAKKDNKLPTYGYLRCPQLLLYIAEIAGISSECVEAAYNTLKTYEDKNNLRDTNKNGDYMWGTKEFKIFKQKLCIGQLVKIMEAAETWTDVQNKAKTIKCQGNI